MSLRAGSVLLGTSAKAHAVFMLSFTVLQSRHTLPHHGATGPCCRLKSCCKADQGGGQITDDSTIDNARALALLLCGAKLSKHKENIFSFLERM